MPVLLGRFRRQVAQYKSVEFGGRAAANFEPLRVYRVLRGPG